MQCDNLRNVSFGYEPDQTQRFQREGVRGDPIIPNCDLPLGAISRKFPSTKHATRESRTQLLKTPSPRH